MMMWTIIRSKGSKVNTGRMDDHEEPYGKYDVLYNGSTGLDRSLVQAGFLQDPINNQFLEFVGNKEKGHKGYNENKNKDQADLRLAQGEQCSGEQLHNGMEEVLDVFKYFR